MLHILIFILKLLGWILLGILGLMFTAIFLFLLVPIRYQVKSSYYQDFKCNANVTWLFGLLSVKADYDKEVTMKFRVFGFRLSQHKNKKAAQKVRDKTKDLKDTMKDELVRDEEETENSSLTAKKSADVLKPEKETIKVKKKTKISLKKKQNKTEELVETNADTSNAFTKKEETEKETSFKKPDSQTLSQPEDAPKKSSFMEGLWSKWKQFVTGLKTKLTQLVAGLKKIVKSLENIREFFTSEENKKTFRLIKRQLFALIRHLRPSKWTIYGRCGFEDPYRTGQLLRAAGLLYPFYHKHITLVPVFDEVILEGEFFIKGRIRLGTMFILGLRVFLDKNFRKILKKWME